MPTQIQFRRGTAAQWTAADPILAEGELGLETDTYLYKIGDGETAWTELDYRELAESFGNTIFNGLDSEPAAPPTDKMALYTRPVAGRMLPRFKGPSGLDSALQPAFFGNGMYIVSPGTSTAMTVLGGPALTAVGTASHPNLNSASLRQSTSRVQVLSAATANSAAELRAAFARSWRGDVAGLGGFFFRMRFAIVSTVANQRAFFGLNSTTSAISTTQDPTTQLNCLGVGNASDDTNLQMLNNGPVGTCQKVDLGSDFPSQGVDDLYELTMFCPPNGDSIQWRMERLQANKSAEGTFTGSKIPASSLFLAPHAYLNNGGTAAAVQFDMTRLYIESDY